MNFASNRKNRTGREYRAAGLLECSAVRIKIYVTQRSEKTQAASARMNNIDEIRVRGIQPIFRIFEVRRFVRWSSRIKAGDAAQPPRHVITHISGNMST
jgi:hypothetical protein